jgi:hypothetical protein
MGGAHRFFYFLPVEMFPKDFLIRNFPLFLRHFLKKEPFA